MIPHNQVVRVEYSTRTTIKILIDMQKTDLKNLALPDTPGVYFFVGPQKEIVYIGKATSLKSRIRSYFAGDIAEKRGPKIQKILEESNTVRWEETNSVLEALLLETELIKKHQPIGNTKEKDNKSFNHIIITKEDFPRVLVARGRDVLNSNPDTMTHVFGPFPQGTKLKEALKIIRKIFPFRDTCTPCTRSPLVQGRKSTCKACFNAQIGLCPGVCTGSINERAYARTIHNLSAFLRGEKQKLILTLTKNMRVCAREEQFEEAEKIKKQLFALEHIRDVALIGQNSEAPELGESWLKRIEAYDIAHMSETSRVGVMTVLEDGTAQKSEYKKFIIKHALPGDVHALAEVLERRLAHTEWMLPTLVVVDGSTAQIRTAQRILKAKNLPILVVGVVKDERHKPKSVTWPRGILRHAHELEKSVLLANAEAHRFAIAFYRAKARKGLTL